MNGIRTVNSDACIGLYQRAWGTDFLFSLFLFIYDNKDSGKKMQLNCKLYCTFTSGNFLYI